MKPHNFIIKTLMALYTITIILWIHGLITSLADAAIVFLVIFPLLGICFAFLTNLFGPSEKK